MTSMTGSLAVDIASDKELTNRLLAAAGLPVPDLGGGPRTPTTQCGQRRGGSAIPVVVKPLDGNHGRGVAINLAATRTRPGAFDEAYDQSRRGYVLVESFITGKDYRVPGHRRPDGRDRRAGAGARHRRRHQHRWPRWSS